MLNQQQKFFGFKSFKFPVFLYVAVTISVIGVVIKNIALATCPLILLNLVVYFKKNNFQLDELVSSTTPTVTPQITSNRVGIFIDGQYLYYGAKSDRTTVSYPKLRKVLQTNTEGEIFFYSSLKNHPRNYQDFLNTLKSMYYTVVCDGDFVSLIEKASQELDTVIIVSGNGDRPLVEAVKNLTQRGVKVKIAAFPSSTDWRLWQAATEYINLLSLPQVCQPKK